MIKNVLLPLGGKEDIDSVVRFLITLIPDRRISVHGLGVVDIKGVEDSLAGAPAGAISMAGEAEKKVSSRERKRVILFIDSIVKRFDKKRIEFDSSVVEGDPEEEILSKSMGFDLLVLCSDSVFSFSRDEEPVRFFSDLIHKVYVPVIYYVADNGGENTGVACDFGKDSSHAINAYLHLGIRYTKKLMFSHVSTDEREEGRFAPHISHFERHGYKDVSKTQLTGDKISAMRRLVETEDIGLLVLGKKGENRLRNYLFGSLTDDLIKDPVCPLFIHD